MRGMIVISLMLCLVSSSLSAQDWAAVQALPADTPIRVKELARRGGEISGRLLTVENAQLTLLRRGTPVVIPKASIARIEQLRRDPVWEGMIIGGLYAAAMRIAFKDEVWRPRDTIGNFVVSIGIGAFIDRQLQGRREIYRASQPATNTSAVVLLKR